MKAYIAGPLFNDRERELNKDIQQLAAKLGYKTFLPQEDGSIAFDRISQGHDATTIRREVFTGDVAEIRSSDVVICCLNGRVPDEGVCIELGIAFALGKRCVGYQTDTRKLDQHGNNLMIDGCLETTCESLDQLKAYLTGLTHFTDDKKSGKIPK